MIQRIQTLYLLCAALFSGGLIFVFSLWTEKSTKVISAILSIVAIFLFKNRQLQFVVGRINMLINFYLLGVLIYVSLTVSGEAQVSEKGIGLFIPIMVIVLLALANKAIKKDEDLVKSVDRLR